MASGTVDVYVKLPTGRTAVYYVQPCDMIEKICRKVAEEEKVKETQVRLKYQGKILDRTHSMSYLGVRPETILKAEILVARSMTLIVTLPEDLGTTEVMTTSLDTITDVTTKIADIIKKDQSHVVMKYEGRQVRGHTLMDAGLVDGSAVEVQVCEEPKAAAARTKGGAGEEGAMGASPKSELKEEDKQAILSSFDTGGKPVDVVFSFDTTGSMYSCLDQVRSKLKECCTRLIQDIRNIRIGIMAHGDYCDEDVIRSVDLTSDVQALLDFVTNAPKTGGGDSPECYEWVLRKAQELDWAEESAKALVVIGDAIPHPPGYTDAQVFWKDELSLLTGMGIKVYGVQALNQTYSTNFYEELADVSGGHYLSMKHFDVITDMFLAVCYRESNEEDLGQFEREVEEAGRMTEERRQIFHSLQTQNAPRPPAAADAATTRARTDGEHRPRFEAASVHDRSAFDYVVDFKALMLDSDEATTDVSHPPVYHTEFTPPVSTSNARKSLRRKKGRKCSVM
ncbi:hypothetical protein ACOMHN_021469 [Nucella lapillus]